MRYKGCIIIIRSFSGKTSINICPIRRLALLLMPPKQHHSISSDWSGSCCVGFLPEPKSLPNDHKINKRVVHFSDLLVFYKANAAKKKSLIKQP